MKQKIAYSLVFFRKKSGLSQEDLADKAGLHRTFISQIERGIKTPSLLSIFKISQALNITAIEFIEKINEMSND